MRHAALDRKQQTAGAGDMGVFSGNTWNTTQTWPSLRGASEDCIDLSCSTLAKGSCSIDNFLHATRQVSVTSMGECNSCTRSFAFSCPSLQVTANQSWQKLRYLAPQATISQTAVMIFIKTSSNAITWTASGLQSHVPSTTLDGSKEATQYATMFS
jgi:hypothetical protein